jgi:NAD-dependent SIR2 family protein deacetylase
VHHALARLETQGRCRLLLTQNVDRLHQAAGSRAAIDLHGHHDLVRCTACLATTRRADFQNDLARLNAEWTDLEASSLRDGDADLDHLDFSGFAMPACGSCGGIQKPDVVKVHAIRDIYDGNRSGTADRSDAPHYFCVPF